MLILPSTPDLTISRAFAVSGEVLAQRARVFCHRCVEFAGTLERAVDNVHDNVRPGDVVMTLGAGNVWQAGELLLEGRQLIARRQRSVPE